MSRKGKLPVSTWLSHVFPSKNGSGISKPPIPPGSSPVVSLEKKIARRAGGLDMPGHSFDGVTRQTGASENGHLQTAVLIIQ